MDSEACGECHKDIYEQWKSSMHHFASFNNQFYRKSDRVHAGRGRHAAEQVVRGLPRSRGLLQRPVRPADQGADRYAGSAGRPGLHVVPRHRARGQHAWATPISPWSIRRCTSWPPARIQYIRAIDYFLTYLNPEAAPATFLKPFMQGLGGVLLGVPQGAPGRAGEPLPLGPRLQRLRQLAGQRRLGTGRAVVLLSGEER